MNQIKEYEVGINSQDKLYCIDSNILLAMCQFYYKGKCDRGNEVTEELKRFILKARNYGVLNSFSITEICYDYTCNTLNSEQMNKIMIAYDNLIMEMSDNEIITHKGAPVPEAKKNLPRNCTFKSIFDCRLPEYLLNGNGEMLQGFYVIYLYFLKIQNLYFERISPIKKVEKLFDFMIDEVNIFLGYEFYLAVLLFLGQSDERNIAEKIFKPTQNPTLAHVLNAVIDIFRYRMVCFMADKSVQIKMPMKHVFVTMDKGLQDYIERCVSYNAIISKKNILPVGYFEMNIKDAYMDDWNEFYNNRYYPCIKSRSMELNTEEINDAERKTNFSIVCKNIRKYEAEIFY